MGNASDPPIIKTHARQLSARSEPKKDLLGIFLCHSIHGANLTYFHHENLVSACETWKMGKQFYNCALIETNHR